MASWTRAYPPTLFQDRTDAGQKLGQELLAMELKDAVVLAIPAGGVPVAAEAAKKLKAPLDLIIARKIQFPWTTEAGFGAVVSDGTVYLGRHAADLSDEVVQAQTRKAKEQVQHRAQQFRQRRKKLDLSGRTVILVDDGLASGSTMLAAVQSIRHSRPQQVIVAVPTASGSAVKLLRPHVDGLVSLYVHPNHLPFAVASSYQNWYDLSDEEVMSYLQESA
jgi:putative phosphoribosyl transferase